MNQRQKLVFFSQCYSFLLLSPNCSWKTQGNGTSIHFRIPGPKPCSCTVHSLETLGATANLTTCFCCKNKEPLCLRFLYCAEEQDMNSPAHATFSPLPFSLSKRTTNDQKRHSLAHRRPSLTRTDHLSPALKAA